jgi:hypothetical protein
VAAVDHSFEMQATAQVAQARFRDESGLVLERMGFQLREESPGHLDFGVRRFRGEWLIRMLLGQQIEVDFTPVDKNACRVHVYGQAGGSVARAISLLGGKGHWPSTLDDPDWFVEEALLAELRASRGD